MEHGAQKRYGGIWKLAQGDEEYYRLMKENAVLERRYFDLLQTLPTVQQDIIQDFLMNCEDLSRRMLEIACTQLRFPSDQEVEEALRQEGAPEEYLMLFREFCKTHNGEGIK